MSEVDVDGPEAISEQSGARSVLYLLRRLPTGVPGRMAITYSSEDPFMRKG
jgi:phage terminase large subunit-like protein